MRAAVLARLLDAARLLALACLALYLPVIVLIALAIITTSPGPPFVRRVYRRPNGQMVDLWEFRTECWCRWEPTPVGRLLRRTTLVRLPALVNVLRGEVEAGERLRAACDTA